MSNLSKESIAKMRLDVIRYGYLRQDEIKHLLRHIDHLESQLVADDGELVTEEFVASISPCHWMAGLEYYWPTIGLRYAVGIGGASAVAREMWYLDNIRGHDPSDPRPLPVKTEGDVRRLLKALGVEIAK